MLYPLQLALNFACTIFPCGIGDQWFAGHNTTTHRVAIIGAGAAGSSAAFWLAKGKERSTLAIDVDVFERTDKIGGRCTVVYPYESTEHTPVELGASIFVDVNKNLVRATKEFNLTYDKDPLDNGLTGVWDGEKFLIKLGGSGWMGNWYHKLQVLWRYGYKAPSRTLQLVKQMTDRYISLYTPDTPKWTSIADASQQLGFMSYTAQTASEYLDAAGVDRRWTREMVEAATRVNYGQNVDTIHALSGMCSMAASDAHTIKGGNFQIFENMMSQSGANLKLNTSVIKVERSEGKWLVETGLGSALYDSVILAAPYDPSTLTLNPLPEAFDPVEYVHLHVTLLSTTSPKPNATYFSEDSDTPLTILTSFQGARDGIKEPPFNSISYHGRLSNTSDEHIVKLFSKSKLSVKWLSKIFNGQIGWLHRAEFNAYPVMKPRVDFPPAKFNDGLYYVNAFEPFISTMETETVASRNIVDLLLEEHFNTSICPQPSGGKPKDTFVYGWDC